ncbi:Heterokaryon incompatibility protein (HET) domain containing protein [Naviculisporaceae sp. PSN 640]
MICQNCRKGFQAAETWRCHRDRDVDDSRPHLVHSTHRSFLESVLRGCPVCRTSWRHLVKRYRKVRLGYDSVLPNHDEVQRHLALMRQLAESHYSEPSQGKPSRTPSDATSTSVLGDARSEDEASLVLQLWRQNTPIPDPWSKQCPVVVWADLDQDVFEVQVKAVSNDSKHARISAKADFDIVPIAGRGDGQDRLIERIGGYRSKACTSANSHLWTHWMGACLRKHGVCNKALKDQSSFFPLRLVKIKSDGDNNPKTWRVRQVRGNEKCPYLTLSHCWGSLQHNHRLTGATLERFLQDGGPVWKLPKTFRDAMSITLSLGLTHIWIDSLCIIQDDIEDWKNQSSVMGLIYKHAVCNIAATWARNGAEGCFNSRNPADIDPGPWVMTLEKGRKKKKKEFRVFRTDYDDLVENAPLNSRGWVLQERWLAPRQLQFTKDEVYWECSQVVASERFPAGMSDDTVEKPRLDHGDRDDLYFAWARMVESYSRARLTVYTDKTIAISGLASEVRDRRKDQYLAGLWRRDLQKQLCWSADFLEHRSRRDRQYRGTAPYIAPSWSWMSIDSEVDYDYMYSDLYGDSVLHLAQVLSASVRSAHPSGLHSFLDGSLRMRVIGFWCRGVADTDPGFETTHVLREPSDPAKRNPEALGALFLGRKIDITWDEGISEEQDTSDSDGISEEESTGDSDSSSEEEESSEEESSEAGQSSEDGWSTCSDDDADSNNSEKGVVNQNEEVRQGTSANPGHPDWTTGNEDEGASKGNERVGEQKETYQKEGRQRKTRAEKNEDHTGLAAGAVHMRRSDLLLAFVHLSTGGVPGRTLIGLVLTESPNSDTELVRLGVFEHRLNVKKGRSSNDVTEFMKSRFGWNGRKSRFGKLEMDLGEPRFADLVQIITIV